MITFNRRVCFRKRLLPRSSRDVTNLLRKSSALKYFGLLQFRFMTHCDYSIHDYLLAPVAFASRLIAFLLLSRLHFTLKNTFVHLLYSKVNTVLIHFTRSKILIATSWLTVLFHSNNDHLFVTVAFASLRNQSPFFTSHDYIPSLWRMLFYTVYYSKVITVSPLYRVIKY